MTRETDLHDAALALLREVPGITVYDGDVDDRPPAFKDGRVKPYAVLWSTPGSFPDEAASTLCDTDTGELAWSARVTVASGHPRWTLEASGDVRRKLSKARLLPASGLLREPLGYEPVIEKDRDVKPLRWFAPLVFYTMSA